MMKKEYPIHGSIPMSVNELMLENMGILEMFCSSNLSSVSNPTPRILTTRPPMIVQVMLGKLK